MRRPLSKGKYLLLGFSSQMVLLGFPRKWISSIERVHCVRNTQYGHYVGCNIICIPCTAFPSSKFRFLLFYILSCCSCPIIPTAFYPLFLVPFRFTTCFAFFSINSAFFFYYFVSRIIFTGVDDISIERRISSCCLVCSSWFTMFSLAYVC